MPVYNAERYVREAIESILNQTFGEFEFIIVDDCSSDGSLGVIESYQDERIVLLRNEVNLGVARSLNRGLAAARGEYLARMDADDRCAPERLARQVEYLDAHPEVAVLGTWAVFIDAAGRQTGADQRSPQDPEEMRWAVLHCPGVPIHPSVMMRTSVLRGAGGYRPFRYGEDYDLWLRLTDRACPLRVLPETLLEFRRHGSEETRRDRPSAWVSMFLVKEAALRRRAGRPDPLEGLDYDGFLALIENVKRGRGPLGRQWEAIPYWSKATELWDHGRYLAALWPLAQTLARCPSHPHLWARLGETVRRRSGKHAPVGQAGRISGQGERP